MTPVAETREEERFLSNVVDLMDRNRDLERCLRELRDALRDCATDLRGELEEKYKLLTSYPSELRKFSRDIAVVTKAEEALSRADALLGKGSDSEDKEK